MCIWLDPSALKHEVTPAVSGVNVALSAISGHLTSADKVFNCQNAGQNDFPHLSMNCLFINNYSPYLVQSMASG